MYPKRLLSEAETNQIMKLTCRGLRAQNQAWDLSQVHQQ